MGMFDSIDLADGREVQVKCLGRMLRRYRLGDQVQLFTGEPSYESDGEPSSLEDFQVILTGGHFLLVTGNRLRIVDDVRREQVPLVDNYGYEIGPDTERIRPGQIFRPDRY